jgi:hypothetical protein
LLGYEAILQIPQVSPGANLIKPDSPQDVPQEFLTHQFPPLIPTKVTPWFKPVAQLLKTPLLYRDQLEASTATETGHLAIAALRSLQFLTSVNPEILKAPVFLEHVPLAA